MIFLDDARRSQELTRLSAHDLALQWCVTDAETGVPDRAEIAARLERIAGNLAEGSLTRAQLASARVSSPGGAAAVNPRGGLDWSAGFPGPREAVIAALGPIVAQQGAQVTSLSEMMQPDPLAGAGSTLDLEQRCIALRQRMDQVLPGSGWRMESRAVALGIAIALQYQPVSPQNLSAWCSVAKWRVGEAMGCAKAMPVLAIPVDEARVVAGARTEVELAHEVFASAKVVRALSQVVDHDVSRISDRWALHLADQILQEGPSAP